MPEGINAMPVSIRVPADVVERLDKVAAILERPRSWVILRAIRQYLADEGKEVLDVQEGIESWNGVRVSPLRTFWPRWTKSLPKPRPNARPADAARYPCSASKTLAPHRTSLSR
jgi:predicted transcriptional regulator